MKKCGRKMGRTICNNCGKEFEKPQVEIDRNAKRNGNNFCSRHCVGHNNSKNLLIGHDSVYDVSKHSNNRGDEYSEFRYHFRNIKNRDKEIDISLDYLRDLWIKQDGKCYYTKIDLVLSKFKKINKNPIYSASVDRIDSSKGYVKGNICWSSRAINHMKGEMSVEMFWELCKHIYNIVKQKESESNYIS